MKKTPKTMKFFKTYLIPYVFNTLALEIVMLCFKPYFMHPFFAIYSLELGNFLSTKFLMMLFILMSFFAMQLIDCIVGMSAERYFAIKNIRTGHSKTPLIIFLILSGSSLVYLIAAMIAVQFQSVRESLILSENEVLEFFEEHLKDAVTIINPASVLIIRPDIPVQKFAMGFGIFVSFVFSRYIAAIVLLILNATNTQMPNMERMSEKLKKNNKMLLKCIFAQFFGFFTLAGLPAFIIVLNFYFLSEPNVIISFCFLFMNCFGLYDIFVTVICVKPYRGFIVKIITYVKRKSLRFLKNKVDPKAASDPRKPSIFITRLFDTSSDMYSKTIR
uniref:Gustatory receptor n=1 Tax=Panagrolaimus davidi TaxID=227884 RepID=A0A914Q2G7_9BILA